MDASKTRFRKAKKTEYSLDELIEMYGKGLQLVDYGYEKQIEVPGVGFITIRRYSSGAEYCVRPNGAVERINEEWFKKINRLVQEEQERNAKKQNKQLSKESDNAV